MGCNYYSVLTNKGPLSSLQQLVLSLLEEEQLLLLRPPPKIGTLARCMVDVPQPGHAVERVPSAMGYCLGILRKKEIVTQEAES